jgi:uncharacterized membrane protein YdbT with pleckstrin-like domain
MASYIGTSLMPDERVVYRAKLHWIAFVRPGILAVGLAPFSFGLSLLILAAPILDRIGTELAITNQRVVAKFGVIRRQTVELRLGRVEGLAVDQGILGRLLGYGSVILAGTGTTQTPIHQIADPIAFRQAVYRTQEEEGSRPPPLSPTVVAQA